MTAFDRAWIIAKAPLWTESGTTADYEPETIRWEPDSTGSTIKYRLLPKVDAAGGNYGTSLPRYWESKDKDARGFAAFREGDDPDDPKDPYHQLSLFEMARDARGKGLVRDRLQEMMAELREQDPEARSTHVTHSERGTADLWDKLVDEGLIDSASTKPYVTTTPDGKLIPKTRRVKE